MDPSGLVSRLHLLRRTLRRRLLAYGCFAVLACAIASLLAIVVIDWLLWLPAVFRAFVAVLFVAGVVGATAHWIVVPARARLGIDEIASRLERHFVHLQDRLSSTVNFLERGSGGSTSMRRQVIANTDEMVARLPLESSLSLGPLNRCGVLFLLCVAALTTTLSASPRWLQTGLSRYVHPLSGTEWPREVSIVTLSGTQTVALGESVTVRMAIERGLNPDLRGIVRFREVDGDVTSLAMQRDRDGTFYATVDAVTTNLEYWFEAGDDSTKDSRHMIKVVRRPEVVEALVDVEPPPYAARRVVRTHDLRDGPAAAPIGGHVTVAVRASKPIPPGPPASSAGLRLETGELIPLEVDPDDHRNVSARLEVTEDVHFRIELRDADGFENRRAVRHSIRAVPDGAPVVTVLEPTSVSELTPRGSLRLLIRVEDDFGVAGLELQSRRASDGRTDSTPLTDRLVVVNDVDGVEAAARYRWHLLPMELAEGDVLVYTVAATDNRETTDSGGQVGRSAPLRIKIISETRFDLRVRDELALLEDRIRRAMLEEADLLDRTSNLVRGEAPEAGLTEVEREQTTSLAAQQSRLVRRVRELARRFGRLRSQMEANLPGQKAARRRIATSGSALRQVATGPMAAASGSLMAAAGQAEALSQQAALKVAVRDEAAAVDSLRSLLRSVSQWGEFQGVLTRTRDLLDRQSDIRAQTAKLGRSLLGKPVSSLTAREAAALKVIHRRQGQLAVEVEQLLSRMRQSLDTARGKDPSGAEAIEDAVRVARARDLPKRVRAAGEAVEGNRTAAAAIDQKAAVEALRRMIAALQEREGRELVRLRKKLQQTQDQVAVLIADQEALKAATHEAELVATNESAFVSLAGEQRTLRRNTRLLGEELEEGVRTAAAARAVKYAAGTMGKAEIQLSQKEAAAATGSQEEALAALHEAWEGLEALDRELAEQALRRSLAHIREGLEAMLSAQRNVNARIDKLRLAIEQRGLLKRSEAREASKLARKQAAVRELLDQHLPDLKKVPIFEWVLGRVAGWMEQSRRRLDRRKVDDELVATTARIVRELEKLINAIDETESMPLSTEFAEAEAAGGGRGEVLAQKPVPTIAELLVLKAMQKELGERTKSLHQSINMDDVEEGQLHELKVLGEDQAQIRRLTEVVTRQAKHP